jgi:hypothetical protein
MFFIVTSFKIKALLFHIHTCKQLKIEKNVLLTEKVPCLKPEKNSQNDTSSVPKKKRIDFDCFFAEKRQVIGESFINTIFCNF